MLIGDPVAHSRSPAMHNAAIDRLGLPFVYVATRVPPGKLNDAIAGFRTLGILGANVTIPHKQAVIPLLDDLTVRARAVGAVNTLFWQDDLLIGDNTDIEGFLAPLPDRPVSRALVLGAGGASRAVCYALRDADELIVAARRVGQGHDVLDQLGINGTAIHLDDASEIARSATLVVNTTPLGGPGREDLTPLRWPDHVAADCVAYDLVYTPSPTRFLREAAGRGLETIDGLPMLRAQASASFRRWTGVSFP